MRIEQLQAFVEIACSKSISIAAQNLFITQPSLSRSIKSLEDELGVSLFIRFSDGVRLTEEGIALFPTIQQILTDFKVLKQQATALTTTHIDSTQNQFKICTKQAIADCILVFAFAALYDAFPNTKFTIEIPNNFDLHTLDYDLFIGLNIEASYGLAIDNDNLEMATIFYDSFSVVMDRHHPLASRKLLDISDLLDYQLIFHSYDSVSNDYYNELIKPSSYNKKLDIILRSNNARVVTNLLLTSETVLCTNSIIATNDYIINNELVVIPLKNFKYHCFCLYKPDSPHKSLIFQLIKILQDTRLKLLSK